MTRPIGIEAQRSARDEADAKADRWNEDHPIGTPVIVTDRFGREFATSTLSQAWAVEFRVVVEVAVDGALCLCLLDRIRPDNTKEPRPWMPSSIVSSITCACRCAGRRSGTRWRGGTRPARRSASQGTRP